MTLETHDRVRVRFTHPLLYWGIMYFALMSVGVALSYWYGPAPTFNPFDIDRNYVAWAFAVYGTWQIFFLNIHRLLPVRIGLAFAFILMVGWGAANTVQSFAGNASFVFPLVFGFMGLFHLKLLTEPAINPLARRREKK